MKTLEPDHYIFAKDYIKPKPQREVYKEDILIENVEGFYDGLPACKLNKRGFTPGVTQQMKLSAKKKALERAYSHLQKRIKELADEQQNGGSVPIIQRSI